MVMRVSVRVEGVTRTPWEFIYGSNRMEGGNDGQCSTACLRCAIVSHSY